MKLTAYARQTRIAPAEFQERLAKHGLEVSKEIVRRWLKGDQPPGTKTVKAIEAATQGQVTRYDLRPDVFGSAPASAA